MESKMKKDYRYIPFAYMVRILLTLLEAEENNEPLSQSELIMRAKIPMTTFYYTIKPALKESPLVEFHVTPERIIEVKLTPQGRKIAKALKTIKQTLQETGFL